MSEFYESDLRWNLRYIIDGASLGRRPDMVPGSPDMDPDTPDSVSGWLPKFNGDFLVQRNICIKIFIKMRSVFFPEIRAKLWENAISCNVNESLQKFIDPDPEADELQNLISMSKVVTKCHISQTVQKVLDSDPDADESQNLIGFPWTGA